MGLTRIKLQNLKCRILELVLLKLTFQFIEETGLVILQLNNYFFPDDELIIICN